MNWESPTVTLYPVGVSVHQKREWRSGVEFSSKKHQRPPDCSDGHCVIKGENDSPLINLPHIERRAITRLVTVWWDKKRNRPRDESHDRKRNSKVSDQFTARQPACKQGSERMKDQLTLRRLLLYVALFAVGLGEVYRVFRTV